MADDYYLNKNQQTNGDYEVHKSTCLYLPQPTNREFLGSFDYCFQAVSEAKQRHPTWWRINGCFYCIPTCHTT